MFTRLNFGKSWTNSKDFPTYEGSEAQVRADMQYHPDAVKDFINHTLLPELEGTSGASRIGDHITGVLSRTLDDIYTTIDGHVAEIEGALAEHTEDIRNLAGGDAPESMRAIRLTFASSDWVATDDSQYQLTIAQSKHKRLNSAFGYAISHKVSSVYKTNTWAVAGTAVSFNESDSSVTLLASSPYAGAIVFFGV